MNSCKRNFELYGFLKTNYNTDFKPVEFEGFRKQAGLNSFFMTPKWIETAKCNKDYIKAKD